MSDAAKMLAAEEATRNDYHWGVAWIARLHPTVVEEMKKAGASAACPDCGEEPDPDEIGVVSDTTTVACGEDGQVAIDRTRARVYDEKEFGVKIVPGSFRLKGLKLLSIREL